MFKVDTNGELTLGGPASGELILDGGYDTTKNSGTKANAALVGVNATVPGKYAINLLEGCTLQNNYNMTSSSPSNNTQHGGAVCFISSNNLSVGSGLFIDGATIQNCIAVHGGGIYFASGTKCAGSYPDNNTQGHFAAAKSYTGAILSMKSGEITCNSTVNGNGGGIYLCQGKMVMEDGSITSNSTIWDSPANTGGGGIFVKSDAVVLLEDGDITCNEAQNSKGCGLFCGTENSHIFIKQNNTNIYISDNTAAADWNTFENISGYFQFYRMENGTPSLTSSADQTLENNQYIDKGEILINWLTFH